MVTRLRSLFSGLNARAWAFALTFGLAMVPMMARATDPVDPDYTLLTSAVWTKLAAGATLILPAVGAIFGILLVIGTAMRLTKRAART